MSSTIAPSTCNSGTDTAEQLNYEKLHFVYWEAAPEFLRKAFHELWEGLWKSPWEDNKIHGQRLLTSPAGPDILSACKKFQREIVESGNSCRWDLPLLVDILKIIVFQVFQKRLKVTLTVCNVGAMTTNNFDKLKNTRNILAHSGKPSLDEATFNLHWEESVRILTLFGMTSDLLEKPKNPESPPKTSEATESEKKADEFRLAGEEFFNKKQFVEAAEEYTKGIDLEQVPPELLGLLYSNRSVAYLQANDFENAKEDAKSCVTLRPSWFCGYTRLGNAYEKLNNFRKATINFSRAIRLGDDSKSTVDTFYYCKMKALIFLSSEHTDVNRLSNPKNWAFIDTDKNLKKFKKMHGTGFEFSIKGRLYETGWENYPLDLHKAAHLYSIAAGMGDASGIYSLALMTQEGTGVSRDMKRGHDLLLKAASKDPYFTFVEGLDKCRNPGVAEACHSLGTAYHYGIAVDEDFEEASRWYHKSLEYGNANSAYNIGHILIDSDNSPEKSEKHQKGVDYFKLAAHLGIVRGMEFLAVNYGDLQEVKLAQEWFLFALSKGSVEFQSEEQRQLYMIDTTLDESTFNPEEFAVQLEKDVRESPVVGSILLKIEDFESQMVVAKPKPAKKRNIVSRLWEKNEVIWCHRQDFNEARTLKKHQVIACNPKEELLTPDPVDPVGVTEIFFKEMEGHVKNKLFKKRVLKVTVIEDAVLRKPSVGLLVEDDNGDVVRVFVQNYVKNVKQAQEDFGYGCRLSIFYPLLQIKDITGDLYVVIDDPEFIMKHSNLNRPTRCRCCGKEGGDTVTCKKCRRVKYCSKTCLKKDADDFKHSLICVKSII